ncbi:MAG: hypothetical protein GC129_06275 [Proteobacteria bacterium]|nr:hypothetical protein [Pseudomonadota bacterium]
MSKHILLAALGLALGATPLAHATNADILSNQVTNLSATVSSQSAKIQQLLEFSTNAATDISTLKAQVAAMRTCNDLNKVYAPNDPSRDRNNCVSTSNFGEMTRRDAGTVYTAESDGIVMANTLGGAQSATLCKLSGFTGANVGAYASGYRMPDLNDPVAAVLTVTQPYLTGSNGEATTLYNQTGLTMAVKKGNQWVVTGCQAAVRWLPFNN